MQYIEVCTLKIASEERFVMSKHGEWDVMLYQEHRG